LTKALIMLVRVLGLAAIVLGALLWTGRQQYLGSHIGGGFLVAIVVFVLAVMALTKKAVVPGILGVVLAALLPVVGFMQLPLTFHTLGAIQVVHIILALATIGVAERLFAAIRNAG
jgi:presenilin-like A22 family membrane protease